MNPHMLSAKIVFIDTNRSEAINTDFTNNGTNNNTDVIMPGLKSVCRVVTPK